MHIGHTQLDAMTAMSAVQKLYEVCKASFSAIDGVPAPEVVASVRAVLDELKCSDLGLDDHNSQNERAHLIRNGRNANRHPSALDRLAAPRITYLHLHECKHFSMGIFCLPQTAVIPLHNHPGMTVFGKLLYGSMHVKSYDWVDPHDEHADANPSIPRLAKVVSDHVLVAPCETSILFPTHGGNIHSFTGVTSCAVLDVLVPPYQTRPCIYYTVSEIPAENGAESSEELVYLEEYTPPSDLVERGIYRGPRVVPSTSYRVLGSEL